MNKISKCMGCGCYPCECKPVAVPGWDRVDTSIGPDVPEAQKPKMTVIDPKTLPQTNLNIGRRMCKLGECPPMAIVRWGPDLGQIGVDNSEVYLVVDHTTKTSEREHADDRALIRLPKGSVNCRDRYDENTIVEIVGFLNVTIA